MSYGIADTIGRDGYLTTLDLVLPEFGGRNDEALLAMFGLAQASPGNNVLSKYLHDNFASFLNEQLLQPKKPDQMGKQKEGVPDALRRTFLKLDRQLHDKLYAPSRKMSQVSGTTPHPQFDSSHRQGTSGIVVYVVGRTLYVANVGRALAVISSHANAELISKKHDP
jgi:adenylate cyclase